MSTYKLSRAIRRTMYILSIRIIYVSPFFPLRFCAFFTIRSRLARCQVLARCSPFSKTSPRRVISFARDILLAHIRSSGRYSRGNMRDSMREIEIFSAISAKISRHHALCYSFASAYQQFLPTPSAS